VHEGQRHRESIRHIQREVSWQAPPPKETGISTARLNEVVDQRLREMFAHEVKQLKLKNDSLAETFAREVQELKLKNELMDQMLCYMSAQEAERTETEAKRTEDFENFKKELAFELEGLKSGWNETKDSVDNLEAQVEKNLDQEDDNDEEPNIALEDQLRITEQSAKAIGLLSDHLLSTVWQTCSKNTYGNKPHWLIFRFLT
jgi:hypothetical protein